MFKHYLKVSFRNLRKYKYQTLVSVIGLAVGFACFAMAALWIRYEMTYDSFHKNADRLYCVSRPSPLTPNGLSRVNPYPLAGYLEATFPEVARAASIATGGPKGFNFELEGVEHKADLLKIDSSFFGMFDVKLVEGSMDFLIPQTKNIAITCEKASQLFGNEGAVGKILKVDDDDYTVCAVVTGLPKRSNYPFDFLQALIVEMRWNVYSDQQHTLIEVIPNTDIKAFERKLHEIKSEHIEKMNLTPLTSVRYTDTNIQRDVKFQHIILFAVAGSLLILCTLFNYLTLFVSRFRIRQREFVLRTVYGASGRSLFAMLSVEFVMSLAMALLLGMLLMQFVFPPFRTISNVKMELSSIYLESIIYIAAIITTALGTFLLTLAVLRRRTLISNIRSNKKMFRKTSIAVQLVISIVFAFCTTVILKQMYYLHNTDLGFAFKNRGSIYISANYEHVKILNDKIKQIPEIEETISGHNPLLPRMRYSIGTISEWEDKHEIDKTVRVENAVITEQYVKHYELELIEGEMLSESSDEHDVLINESAAKAFGWNKAVGKTYSDFYGTYRVTGVLKNIYNMSPTIAAQPYSYSTSWRDWTGKRSAKYDKRYILFKYNEGNWKICAEKIKKIIAAELPNTHTTLANSEEEYDKFLKSENVLLAILTVISIICMIVCIFGFVSMVSLTCEERRKEIAIRKINGATIKDILDIFFKEHLTLLAVGALFAFSAGYLIMRRWLESYVTQTEISAWIYVLILLALSMAIVLCVGGRVYKTSRENPINAIQKL
jgi:ABC-type antimicrobial peptide transport system permease subunit